MILWALAPVLTIVEPVNILSTKIHHGVSEQDLPRDRTSTIWQEPSGYTNSLYLSIKRMTVYRQISSENSPKDLIDYLQQHSINISSRLFEFISIHRITLLKKQRMNTPVNKMSKALNLYWKVLSLGEISPVKL